MRVVILAGTIEEATNCAMRFGLPGEQGTHWFYPEECTDLDGLHNAEIVITGSFNMRPNCKQLLNAATKWYCLGNRIDVPKPIDNSWLNEAPEKYRLMLSHNTNPRKT